MLNPNDKKAKDVMARKRASHIWIADNFHEEWKKSFQAYACERDPVIDEKTNKPDPTVTSIATPLTTSYVNRLVARITAQSPHIMFRGKDDQISEMISRAGMYCWDKANVQRKQKRHVRQASIFGWSVRAWYWDVQRFPRRKKVDPFHPDPEIKQRALSEIERYYNVDLENRGPEAQQYLLGKIVEKHGRGGLVPVEYEYKAYEGPNCDFIFIGDCYPEPHFESIQSSAYFVIERRRPLSWIRRMAKLYPKFSDGFNELLRKHPKGTPPGYLEKGDSDRTNFRSHIADALDKDDYFADEQNSDYAQKWTITEEHIPGRRSRFRWVGEDGIWIGEADQPVDLDGHIPFTECILIDAILGGIGDSNARFGRGLQALYDRQFNTRDDLIDTISHPWYATGNRQLFEDPSKMARGKGFRLILCRPDDLQAINEAAAAASAAASLTGSDAPIMRMWQMLTGENNLSQNANVDPQQARTATGARLMAYQGDILSKDLLDMFRDSSLNPDAEMIYRMNRSELTEPMVFEAGRYNRKHDQDKDPYRDQWMKVEPLHFQEDGEITVEAGSTLADDDETRTNKAVNLFATAGSRPDLFNQQTARDRYLQAMGEGSKLNEWAAPPPPPPPEPPPVKPSLSVSVKFEMLPPEAQVAVMNGAGIQISPEGQQQLAEQQMVPPPGMPAMPPGGPAPGPPSPPAGPQPVPPRPRPPNIPPESLVSNRDELLAASGLKAARGQNPIREGS